MWFDDLPPGRPWTALWSGYVLCECGGIRTLAANCPACAGPPPSCEPRTVRTADGQEVQIHAAFAGAEGRFEDYIYLAMLEREWNRSDGKHDWLDNMPPEKRPSSRATVVLLFWSYFETRIERLLRMGFKRTPIPIIEDVLSRYSAIGARLDRLYRLLYDSTYRRDLEELGFGDVWLLLTAVQARRNSFVHGEPEKIDEALVTSLVENLKREHDAWIAVFNRRVSAK